jgi:hypothetical protein
VPAPIWEVFQQDPFFVYTLIAALLLGVVSLVTGWLRLDFLILFRGRSLFHIALLSHTLSAPFTASATTGEAVSSNSFARCRFRCNASFFIVPKVYQKFFAGSRIAPPILHPEPVALPKSIGFQAQLLERERQCEWANSLSFQQTCETKN